MLVRRSSPLWPIAAVALLSLGVCACASAARAPGYGAVRHGPAPEQLPAVELLSGTARRAPVLALLDSSRLRLVLNVPAYRLDLHDGVRIVRSYRTAVGLPEYPTPVGTFRIDWMQWNPGWVPPESDWSAGQLPMDPGPANPMGRVKMHFRELYFVHGSPETASIGTAAAHGCVRLLNDEAVRLASVLQRGVLPPLVDDSIVAAFHAGRTVTVMMPRAIPLEIRYDLAEIRGGALVLHPDIYGRGGAPIVAARAALQRAGLDTAVVDFVADDELMSLTGFPARRVVFALRWTDADR